MGLWGWLKRTFGDEPMSAREKATRGPGKSNAERLAGQRVRNMNWLKKNDPEAYHQAILRETGVVRDASSPISQLKELAELQKAGRKLGLMGEGAGGGDSIDKFIEAAPKLMTAIAPLLLGALPGAPRQPVSQPLQIEAPKPRRRRRAQTETVDGDAPIDELATTEEDDPEEDEPMFQVTPEIAASLARANMDGKSPREAARFLLSQEKHAAVKGMIDVLLTTPDAQLFATLRAHAASTNQPALIALMAWFESQPSWTFEIAAIIRSAKRPAAARGKLRAI